MFKRLADAELKGKRALIRVDFNVPMQNGAVTDDTRLKAAKDTIETVTKGGGIAVLLAHFDRPKGKRVPSMSLAPVVPALEAVLSRKVVMAPDCVGPEAAAVVKAAAPGAVVLLENTRFHAGEEANDAALAREMAALGDLYVNDAFSAAHRAHASTEGIAHVLPAYAGKAMEAELDALNVALGVPRRPVLGIVGGSKVSTKLDLLRNLVTKLDKLAIGGGMANTFLYAQGWEVGASYCEKDLAETAREIMKLAGRHKCELLLPIDTIVAEKLDARAPAFVRGLGDIDDDERILDAGPETIARLTRAMDESNTLIWNGPLGVFETPPFDHGTVAAARHAGARAKSGKLIAVAGGGDTVAALNHAGVAAMFTFVSTAGGAFLEWMEGKPLPGVKALEGA